VTRGTGAPGVAGIDIDIDLPTGWSSTVHEGPVALVARPQAWPGGFTPTITVTTSATPGVTTLAEYCDAQLDGVATTVGGHLVHLATSHRPHAHLDLTLAIEQVGVDLTVAQRHLVDPRPDGSGCVAVVATAVAADGDWPHLAPALVAAVRSVRPAGP
jgi:hypothetical protein